MFTDINGITAHWIGPNPIKYYYNMLLHRNSKNYDITMVISAIMDPLIWRMRKTHREYF